MAKKTKSELPKAKDIDLALKHVPKWRSAIQIPQFLVEIFDVNPGLIGRLTPELMEQMKGQTEGKLLQVEMAEVFYDHLVLACGAHKEIEGFRHKSAELMFDTKTRENVDAMESLLASTKYEEHLVTWNHELKGNQNFITDKGEYERQVIDADLCVRLRKAYDESERKRTGLEASLTEAPEAQVIDLGAQKEKRALAAEQKSKRAEFQKLISRG